MNAAKLAYKPVGLVGGIVGGVIASSIFNRVWKAVDGTDEVPDAKTRDTQWTKVLLAAALQGAIYSAVKTGVDRAGARAFEHWTGDWPG